MISGVVRVLLLSLCICCIAVADQSEAEDAHIVSQNLDVKPARAVLEVGWGVGSTHGRSACHSGSWATGTGWWWWSTDGS